MGHKSVGAGHWLVCAALLGLFGGCKKGDANMAWIELCSGYATPSGGLLIGRVHSGAPLAMPQPEEATWQRVSETIDALEAHPLANSPITITVGGRPFKGTVSNDRGYIDLAPLTGFSPTSVPVHLELEDSHYQAVGVDGELPVYDAEPGFAVITDIDDTLLDSGVTHKLQMLKNAATRSTWELKDFPDAARVLGVYAQGRPIFYVSGSPWGFRHRIGDFFTRQGYPKGPFMLKRFSSEPLTDQLAFKLQHIGRIFESLPSKRWYLFGDSGEKDPEVYSRLRQEHPDQVEAIFIHLVTDEAPTAPRFAGMTAFRAWNELPLPAASPVQPAPAKL